jgi:hypothetical protein
MRLALLLFALTVPALAQTNTCGGLTSVTDSARPVYSPIAIAAHVQGQVIMLVTFKTTGKVKKVEVLSGQNMLLSAATKYVEAWRANPYDSLRTCQVSVHYELSSDPPKQPFLRADPQHVTIYAKSPELVTSY